MFSVAKAACEECQRRKIRCDGQKPQCRTCEDVGLLCVTSQRGARGPKKGYIKAMKSRLMHLEALLESRNKTQQQQQCPQEQPVDGVSDASTVNMPIVDAPWLSISEPEVLLSGHSAPIPDLNLGLLPWALPLNLPSLPSFDLNITEVIRSELDQLYIDRVHPSFPIIHQHRYLSWSKSVEKTQSRICLQYAMWTLATLLSAQFRDLTEPLYHETKQMLESQSNHFNKSNACDTELIQACVLVATCELMRTFYQQAWMSAGMAFRFVQGMRLHEIDSPDRTKPTLSDDNFIEVEEKRRVFWMAYFLDHLFSIRNDWPITLNEHVICTRLPMRDVEFQSNQRVQGDFLSEAMTQPRSQPPFNECIILVTLSGRSLLHRQQFNISKAYGETSLCLDQQRNWLNSILGPRLEILSHSYFSGIESQSPLLLFANILSQATVIYYCKNAMDVSDHYGVEEIEKKSDILEFQRQAAVASMSLVRLAKSLCELHISKVHPLMPIPLIMSAEFLYNNRSSHESFRSSLSEMFLIFGQLRNVNNEEQSYLDLLPRSCIAKTLELREYSTKEGWAS